MGNLLGHLTEMKRKERGHCEIILFMFIEGLRYIQRSNVTYRQIQVRYIHTQNPVNAIANAQPQNTILSTLMYFYTTQPLIHHNNSKLTPTTPTIAIHVDRLYIAGAALCPTPQHSLV